MKTPTPPKTPPKVERAEAKADKSVTNLEGLTERLGTALEGILRVPARSRSEYLEKVQSALSGLFARLGGATEKMVDSLSGTLEAAAAKSDGSALALTTTYAEMRSTLKFAESDTMERVRHAVESFGGKPVAMETVRDKVMEELEPENGPQVRYANGARMSLKAYATMAARTARTETANMTALAQARETGTDYVYVPATTQGCELCISRSGRVYCISGKDSRFPPLTDLFPGSYKTIHPNCRCPLVPWYPEQYTPEEMRQAVQESNRSAKVKQDSPVLARYKKQQEYNRQIIAEQRDFEAARQKYGAAMPYQSIASYRRAVRDFKKKHGTTKGFWESKGLTSGAKSDIIKPKQYKTIASGEAANRFFDKEDRRWRKKLTPKEAEAIKSYCGMGFLDINTALRGNSQEVQVSQSKINTMRKNMDSAISKFKLEENIRVFRGVDYDGFDWNDLNIGYVYKDVAYMSTSPVRNEATDSKDVLLVIDVPSGKGRGAYVNSLSGYRDQEYEFLLKRGTQCKVSNIETVNGKKIIYMEVFGK